MTTNTQTTSQPATLGLLALTAFVVSSMIGSGIFSLPQNIAVGAGPGALLVSWLITTVGMLGLTGVFQLLARRQPRITGGVYGYARAGFGHFIGFLCAWGYWLSAFLGNVSYLIILMSATSYFFPQAALGNGNTPAAIVIASILLWGVHILVLSGIRTAVRINTLATLAKILPLIIFILCVLLAFNADTFNTAFWGNPRLGNILDQVKSTMLVTVWLFIGIESASVYSSRATRTSDVGCATLLGFLLTLTLLMAVSLLSMGIFTQSQLATLKNPSMVGILETIIGPWGRVIILAGLILSVMGSLLTWTLLAAEIPFLTARDGVFPALFTRTNAQGTPTAALWLTNLTVQAFLILSYIAQNAYLTMLKLATSTILIPYLLCATYAWLIAYRGEGYHTGEPRGRDKGVALLGIIYGIWLIYAADPSYLLLTSLLYASGIFVFIWSRHEHHAVVFHRIEWFIALSITIAAIVCTTWLALGKIDLAKL